MQLSRKDWEAEANGAEEVAKQTERSFLINKRIAEFCREEAEKYPDEKSKADKKKIPKGVG